MDFKHHNPKKELTSLYFPIGNWCRFFELTEVPITKRNFNILGL